MVDSGATTKFLNRRFVNVTNPFFDAYLWTPAT